MVTAGGGELYFVTLVWPDGVGGASAQATSRSQKTYYYPPTPCVPGLGGCQTQATANYSMPEISISAKRVYFLEGETQIKSLAPDGVIQPVMNIPAPPNSYVVFAVSPDDKRIAVSVITLATTNVADSFTHVMYVADTGTGAHRVDLYSSTSFAEWPVGWHAGNLVVAVAPDITANPDNSYRGVGYRTVDPANGRTLTSLDCTRGLLVAAGTGCATGFCSTASTCQDGSIGKQDWNGAKTTFGLPSGPMPKIFLAFDELSLSPDGTRIAAAVVTDPKTGSVETDLFGDGSQKHVTDAGGPQGWIDRSHLVVSSYAAPSVWIIDVDTGTKTQLNAPNMIAGYGQLRLAGVLPASL